MFADAAPGFAEHAERMGFVDHQEGLVALLDVDEARQVGDVAIHAVEAFDDDQRALEVAADFAEDVFQRGRVVVVEGAAGGAGKLDAFENAVVDQAVMDDQVLGAEQRGDGRHVGGMAADEGDAVLDFVEAGNGFFELALDRPLAGDQTAGRSRGAVAVDGFLGGPVDARVSRQPEVVVAGKVDIGFAADHRRGVGDAIVRLEEGILDAQLAGGSLRNGDFLVAWEFVEAAEFFRNFCKNWRRP